MFSVQKSPRTVAGQIVHSQRSMRASSVDSNVRAVKLEKPGELG